MTPTEERAVLERAAKWYDETGWKLDESDVAAAIRSLPLESKESEVEPVWLVDHKGHYYTNHAECPKCEETNTQWEVEFNKQMRRAEAAEAKYQSAAAVTGNMMAEYANMRDQLAKVREATIEEIRDACFFHGVEIGRIIDALKEKP